MGLSECSVFVCRRCISTQQVNSPVHCGKFLKSPAAVVQELEGRVRHEATGGGAVSPDESQHGINTQPDTHTHTPIQAEFVWTHLRSVCTHCFLSHD